MIEDVGFVVEPSVDTLAETLDRTLDGERPPQKPTDRATKYDWDNVASQAEMAYQRAIVGGSNTCTAVDNVTIDRRSVASTESHGGYPRRPPASVLDI